VTAGRVTAGAVGRSLAVCLTGRSVRSGAL
jgi:hypothetical protein